MTTEAAARVVKDIEAQWEPFWIAALHLDEEKLSAQTPAGWTAKEMLAHVAFWDEAVVGVVTRLIRNQPLPEGWLFGSGYVPPAPEDEWPAADVHNEREAEWGRGQPGHAVLARCESAHEQMLAMLGTLTEAECEENADYLQELAEHYVEHIGEVRALLDPDAPQE